MNKHVEAAPIWFPNQRVWRTILQYIAGTFVGLFLALSTVQVFAPAVLEQAREILPPSWFAWLAGAIAFCGALAGVLSKVMAIPIVNDWLSRNTPFGSAPSRTIQAGTVRAATSETVMKITSLPDEPGTILAARYGLQLGLTGEQVRADYDALASSPPPGH
jgi:hypothetical protein